MIFSYSTSDKSFLRHAAENLPAQQKTLKRSMKKVTKYLYSSLFQFIALLGWLKHGKFTPAKRTSSRGWQAPILSKLVNWPIKRKSAINQAFQNFYFLFCVVSAILLAALWSDVYLLCLAKLKKHLLTNQFVYSVHWRTSLIQINKK